MSLMKGLGLLVLYLVLASGCAATQMQSVPPAPPSHFQTLAEVDLADQPYVRDTLGQFTLEETAVAGIHYAVHNIDTAYFNLSLLAEDGTSYLILESEDYRTDENGGGFWERQLAPGTYRLLLSAPQSPGTLAIKWGTLVEPSTEAGS